MTAIAVAGALGGVAVVLLAMYAVYHVSTRRRYAAPREAASGEKPVRHLATVTGAHVPIVLGAAAK